MNLSAPLDELFEWVDKIQSWLDANRLIREALNQMLSPLFNLEIWKGQFTHMFQEVVTAKILDELKPIITVIDIFFDALNAVIDTIQTLLEWLLNPVGSLVDAIGDLY